jgi:uncharacterized protein YcbK (DUF882 family)
MTLPLFRRAWQRTGKRVPPYRRVWIRNYPTTTHYSQNFTRKELDCKCGCTTPAHIQRELVDTAYELEKLRKELGGPVRILSGYRCPTHNKRVRGAPQSQHMTGKAVDLGVPKDKQPVYVGAATRVPAFKEGGIGVYPGGGVHVDRRGTPARWNDWTRS